EQLARAVPEAVGNTEPALRGENERRAVGEFQSNALPARRGILAHGRGACFDADDGEGRAGEEDKHRDRGEADRQFVVIELPVEVTPQRLMMSVGRNVAPPPLPHSLDVSLLRAR